MDRSNNCFSAVCLLNKKYLLHSTCICGKLVFASFSLFCSIFLDPNLGSPGDTGTRKGLTWCFTNVSWIPSVRHSLCSIKAGSVEQAGKKNGLQLDIKLAESLAANLDTWRAFHSRVWQFPSIFWAAAMLLCQHCNDGVFHSSATRPSLSTFIQEITELDEVWRSHL